MEETKKNGSSVPKDEPSNQQQQSSDPAKDRVSSDRNSNNSQTLWSIMPKNSRKRKRNREQEQDVSGAEGTDTDETEDTSPNTSIEPSSSSPTSSSSRRVRRKKRKHHSHPKQRERNILPTESDYLVYSSTANNAPNNSNNSTAAGNRSSISDSEDFELLDEFSNLYASARLLDRPTGSARPIAIDGCNVAWGHGNDQEFSYKGIILCADYFRARGHSIVKAFVPRQHQHLIPKQVVEEMTRDEILVFTPSRKLGNQGRRISSYDDRFIVQYAVLTGGIVISNDNFQDLYNEQPAWRETIASRVLQHTWISKDILMFPLDPLGRKGKQTLDEFLHFPQQQQAQQSQQQSSSITMTPTTSVSAPAAGSSESNTSNLSVTTTNKSVSWKSLKQINVENVDESETEEEE